jgi:hypothetical protein
VLVLLMFYSKPHYSFVGSLNANADRRCFSSFILFLFIFSESSFFRSVILLTREVSVSSLDWLNEKGFVIFLRLFQAFRRRRD